MSYHDRECPHCGGTGVCQHQYHENTATEWAADFILGADCPGGCGGSSAGPGDCPHCKGTGYQNED